ncbi:MAG: glycosyltransferase family 4 protein [Rivularia sp. (in: cyanobacteria)]
MRLLIAQYAGDYRKTFYLVRNKGIETYNAQKYVIDTVTNISKQIDEVILLCCHTKEIYNQEIEPGIRVISAGVEPYENIGQILKIIQEQKPTHLIVHFPIVDIFNWAIKHQVKLMALFADCFLPINWKQRIRNYYQAKIFNHQQVDWVANHGLNACYSLQKIGVNPDKIIPWDLKHEINPQPFKVKKLKPNLSSINLVYVGLIDERKGVGDIITAIAKLRHIPPINLKIAGSGDITKLQRRAEKLQISKQVKFLGLISQKQVIEIMRDADAVVVPSWHKYPEACPFTIYESLCTHTPIIASDHPMFRGNLIHRQNAMIFPERKPKLLAQSIQELFASEELYHRISLNSEASWEHLQMPVKWGDLITNWLFDSPVNQKWLSDRSLSSGLYNHPNSKALSDIRKL